MHKARVERKSRHRSKYRSVGHHAFVKRLLSSRFVLPIAWVAVGLVGAVLIGGPIGMLLAAVFVVGGGVLAAVFRSTSRPTAGVPVPRVVKGDAAAATRTPDQSFSILPRGALAWPHWLWVASSFFAQPEVLIAGERHTARWYKETRLFVEADGAEIAVTHMAPSWGPVPEAKAFVRPGDRLLYRASVWPWRKGKIGPA
jgi:hypothetical protein